MQQDFVARRQNSGAEDEAPDDHRQHARQHRDAGKISQQAVQLPGQALPQKMKIGEKAVQNVAQVDQQEIKETPDDQQMEQVGPEADLEGGLENCHFRQDGGQPFRQ